MSSPRPREEKKVDEAKIEEFKRRAEAGDFKQAIQLLNEGVDINTAVEGRERGGSILHEACYRGKSEIVELLLTRKAAIDAQDVWGNSAMHLAAVSSVECLKVLIDHKGDIDLPRRRMGATPLMRAAFRNNADCVRLLLEHKADPSKADEYGRTALDIAIENKREPGIISLLQEVTPIDEKKIMKAKIKQFEGSVTAGDFKQAIKQLDDGVVDIDTIGGYGEILRKACERGEPEIVEQLLMRGAEINAKNSYGQSAMHIAAEESMECLKLLIDNKGDIDMKDNRGLTPLMTAVISNDTGCIKLLLESKADSGIVNNHGGTALDVAIECEDREEAIGLLMDANSSKLRPS